MVAKRVMGLPDSEITAAARYERREAAKVKVENQLRAELFTATVNAFPELVFQMQPVAGFDNDKAIGITLGISDDAILPKLKRWAYVHSHTMESLLDLVGAEAGRRVAKTRLGDVDVSVVGKAKGDPARGENVQQTVVGKPLGDLAYSQADTLRT